VCIPEEYTARLVSSALACHGTDWHIDQLYSFAADLGATTVHTAVSRTVIDVNRDPSGASLYPGQPVTGLVPIDTFDGRPLYRDGATPSSKEIERRKKLYFAPYHAALAEELARLRGLHKRVVLYDCHSIRSVIPRLFPGELPVFNIGTNNGKACDPTLTKQIASICAASRWSHVVNGRFTGGWITCTYGRPRGADGTCDPGLSSRRERSAAVECRFRQAHPADFARRARSLPRVCSLLRRIRWLLASTTRALSGHLAANNFPPGAG
jgi:formiminoglutamase